MVKVQTVARRWGSSLGIIFPKECVEAQGIKEGESLVVDVRRKRLAKEFFGILGGWKKSPQELKDEGRKGWE